VTEDDRPLPASEEHERHILGLMLKDDAALLEARSSLAVSEFSLDSHRRIFHAICEIDDEHSEVNFATIGQWLKDHRELEAVGGMAYLSQLDADMPSGYRVGSYVKTVKEKTRLRRLIETCQTAISGAYGAAPSLELISGVQDGIEAALGAQDDNPLVESYSVSALDELEAERNLQKSPGLSYGITKLDDATGGMRKGEVIVVGARSGVGKTSLMCQAAVANAGRGIPCDLFSLEMTRNQILRRIWSIVSGVPYRRVTDPWKATDEEAQRIRTAASKVCEWPLRIHDNGEMPLSKIVSMARLSIKRHGSRFIAVDYAQEVDAPGKDERAKVMAVCRKLTRLVKHEDCSLMLLSQLLKVTRDSYDKPPMVGDLVESGKLENVAHLVLLLHRSFDTDADGNPSHLGTKADLIIPKQRRGETGVKPARFNRALAIYEAT
jgi:replicative DNA helicase